MKLCNMLPLLNDESLIKYYWLGFLLADGSFASRGRLKVTVSSKDENHLKKLQEFLQIKNIYNTFGVYPDSTIAGMDVIPIKELCKRYNIHSNKTENPPSITSIIDDKLKAFSIGFIDGDGSICKYSKRKDAFIRIKLHKTWLDTLNYIYPNKAKINKEGYAEARICGFSDIKKLKKFGIENQLPLLERKWDKIDLEYITKTEKRNKI